MTWTRTQQEESKKKMLHNVAGGTQNIVGGSNSSTHTASGESAWLVLTCCYGITVDHSGIRAEAEIKLFLMADLNRKWHFHNIIVFTLCYLFPHNISGIVCRKYVKSQNCPNHFGGL